MSVDHQWGFAVLVESAEDRRSINQFPESNLAADVIK